MTASRGIYHYKINQLSRNILSLLNSDKGQDELMTDIVLLIQAGLGYEAVGLRLNDGNDYPYFFTRGFSQGFVEKEMFLCQKNEEGLPCLDENGQPVLECMCGRVIDGIQGVDCPFITKFGSFWTNGTTQLLASTTEEDRQGKTRNRCNKEGYESVALIPIRVDGKTYGLLQLNDKRKNRFTVELITFFEGIATNIGLLFAMRQSQSLLKQKNDDVKRLVITRTAQINRILSVLKGKIDENQIDPGATAILEQLEAVIAEVEALKGILTICCNCKKIRNDSGGWEQVERYVANHSAAQFSHSYCPECFKKFMGQYNHDQVSD